MSHCQPACLPACSPIFLLFSTEWRVYIGLVLSIHTRFTATSLRTNTNPPPIHPPSRPPFHLPTTPGPPKTARTGITGGRHPSHLGRQRPSLGEGGPNTGKHGPQNMGAQNGVCSVVWCCDGGCCEKCLTRLGPLPTFPLLPFSQPINLALTLQRSTLRRRTPQASFIKHPNETLECACLFPCSMKGRSLPDAALGPGSPALLLSACGGGGDGGETGGLRRRRCGAARDQETRG